MKWLVYMLLLANVSLLAYELRRLEPPVDAPPAEVGGQVNRLLLLREAAAGRRGEAAAPTQPDALTVPEAAAPEPDTKSAAPDAPNDSKGGDSDAKRPTTEKQDEQANAVAALAPEPTAADPNLPEGRSTFASGAGESFLPPTSEAAESIGNSNPESEIGPPLIGPAFARDLLNESEPTEDALFASIPAAAERTDLRGSTDESPDAGANADSPILEADTSSAPAILDPDAGTPLEDAPLHEAGPGAEKLDIAPLALDVPLPENLANTEHEPKTPARFGADVEADANDLEQFAMEARPAAAAPVESGASLREPDGPAQEAADALASKPVAPVCYRLGPYSDEVDANAAVRWLAARNATATLVVEPVKRRSAVWIYLPASEDRNEAVKRSREMSRRGVKDLYVVNEGDNRNAISLGVYSHIPSLERRLDSLRALGYEPQTIERFRDSESFWIDVTSARPLALAREELTAQFPAVDAESRACEGAM